MLKLSTLLLLLCALPVAAAAFYPADVWASPATNEACDAIGGCEGNAGSDIQDVIRFAVNLFTAVVGIIAVIMIVVGGFKYITSGGDSSKTSSAKNTIIYAIVGLVVAAFAQFIVWFVLNQVG